MLLWSWVLCVLAAVSVWAGELAQADSWLLMVEAGRDGPGRRITPKSVFIAPSLSPRAEKKCSPGFRMNHLGRCVRLVHVNQEAQLDLLLKQLQLTHTPHTHKPYVSKTGPSSGPLHFSLSLEPPDSAEATTIKEATQSITEKLPIPPSSTSVPPTTPPKDTVESSTKSSATESTTDITLVTREIHTKDAPSTTELPQETTTWDQPLQTSTSTTLGEDFTKLEGSGEPTPEGSGWSSTTLEGSGSTTETWTSLEGSGVGTSFTEPETTTVSMDTNEEPLQPNPLPPSLLLEVLKGVEVKGVETKESTTSSKVDDRGIYTVQEKNQTGQLPIIEYIDLFIPEKDQKEMSETKETVLIPLDSIQFNISSTENEVMSPMLDKFELVKPETSENAPVLTPMPPKEETGPQELRPHQWPWLQLGADSPSQIQIDTEATSSSAQSTQSGVSNQDNQATHENQPNQSSGYDQAAAENQPNHKPPVYNPGTQGNQPSVKDQATAESQPNQQPSDNNPATQGNQPSSYTQVTAGEPDNQPLGYNSAAQENQPSGYTPAMPGQPNHQPFGYDQAAAENQPNHQPSGYNPATQGNRPSGYTQSTPRQPNYQPSGYIQPTSENGPSNLPPGYNANQPFQPSFGYTTYTKHPSQAQSVQEFLHGHPKRPDVNNHRPGLTTNQAYRGSGSTNYEPTQPEFFPRIQPNHSGSDHRIKDQHHRRPPNRIDLHNTAPELSKDSREKIFDNWWTETMPFDPTWIRFPDGEQQTFRKGSPEEHSEKSVASTEQAPGRFRFPEESVDPAHRPVILKFWSRIPMIRGDSGSKHFESDEDHWTGP